MKRTRLKIALFLLVFFGLIVMYCLIWASSEYVGIIERAIAAIMVVAPAYILGDSYRKSDKPTI